MSEGGGTGRRASHELKAGGVYPVQVRLLSLEPPGVGDDTETFDVRIQQFLNRWLWSGTENKAVVEAELHELIALGRQQVEEP